MKKICLILAFTLPLFAFAEEEVIDTIIPEPEIQKLKVAVKETPPFIIKSDSGYSGVSIELWNSIAADLGLEFSYEEYILADMLDALKNSEVDVCISPLTVTSNRLKDFDFLQPFYITNLTIAIAHVDTSFGKKFFSIGLIKTLLLLLVLLVVLGFFLWLSEKKHYHGDSKSGMGGIPYFTGFLLGIKRKQVDTISKSGGLISVLWGFMIIFILSGYAVSVFFSLNINKLTNELLEVNDLNKVSVGVINGSAPADYLASQEIEYITFGTMEEMINGLQNKKVEAIVHDEPIIRYFLFQKGIEENIQVLPVKFNTQYYSFSVPTKSIIQYDINPLLFQMIENNEHSDILGNYNLEN